MELVNMKKLKLERLELLRKVEMLKIEASR